MTSTRQQNGDRKTDLDYAAEVFELLEEFRLRPVPTPPFAVKEYMEFDYKHIQQMNHEGDKYPKFWRNPEVKKYFDDLESVVYHNERNLKVLRWVRNQYRNDVERSMIIDGFIFPFLEAKYCRSQDGMLKMIGYEDINWPLFNFTLAIENDGPSPAQEALPLIAAQVQRESSILDVINNGSPKEAAEAIVEVCTDAFKNAYDNQRQDSIWEE